MPHISMMAPKPYLDAADFYAVCPQGAIVTYESCDYEIYKRGKSEQVTWYFKVKEFKKSFKLPPSVFRDLGDFMGSQVTEDWAGKTFVLISKDYDMVDEQGKRKRGKTFDFDCATRPTTRPTLQPNQDITGAAHGALGSGYQNPALPQTAQNAPGATSDRIGIDKAVEMVAAMEERGRGIDSFIMHCKDLGLGDFVIGKEPPDWPTLILAIGRKYVTSCAPLGIPKITAEGKANIRARWEPPAPKVGPDDIIDPVTGEAIDIPF